MTVLDASVSGLAPGTAQRGVPSVVQLGDAERVEVRNRGAVPLWFAVNPVGDDFAPEEVGCQVVDPGQAVEVDTTGTTTVVVRATELDCDFQVRRAPATPLGVTTQALLDSFRATATALVVDEDEPTEGDTVTFTATVTHPGLGVTPTGSVRFYADATAMGAAVALTAGAAEKATSALTTGEHSVTAVFVPGEGSILAESTSDPVVVTVAPGE